MQTKRFQFNELTDQHLEAWGALQRENPAYDSPFFRPEFAQLVATVRPNVEVAVLTNGERAVGFWPYERVDHVARPLGLFLCDFQGMIAEPGLDWSPLEVVKQCRLSAWSFDHLIASQAARGGHQWAVESSPFIELKSGFKEYCKRKRSDGSTVEKALRKMRKLERELGPIRFVPYSDDEQVLETVFKWKRDQYRRVHSVDYLSPEWIRGLLRRIAESRSEDFGGMLSAIYAGDHLLAAHLGLRSRNVLHAWFPVYNEAFQQHSPGLLCWLTIAEHAGELGIERIDLGKGSHRFKHSLKTGETLVAEGAVDTRRIVRRLHKGSWLIRRMVRNSRLAEPLRIALYPFRAAAAAN